MCGDSVAAVEELKPVPLNVPMAPELHARMKSRAALTGHTIRSYVIEAVVEKLERDEAAERERRQKRP